MAKSLLLQIVAGAQAFHNQHNSTCAPGDELMKVHARGPLTMQTLMHDYMHFAFNLTVEDEEKLSFLETHIKHGPDLGPEIKEMADSLSEEFKALWMIYG